MPPFTAVSPILQFLRAGAGVKDSPVRPLCSSLASRTIATPPPSYISPSSQLPTISDSICSMYKLSFPSYLSLIFPLFLNPAYSSVESYKELGSSLSKRWIYFWAMHARVTTSLFGNIVISSKICIGKAIQAPVQAPSQQLSISQI